uniref:Titin n=1 Tax=Maylandia zebra TaxID=106582 RepID=A0A3P9BEB5_9CICH
LPRPLSPSFLARPQNQEVVEGEKAEFSCSVSKDTYEVKWFRGDKEIEAGDKYGIISEGKRRALIVKSCELKDEGGYTAHIGTVKAVADLLVIGKTLMVFVISYYRFQNAGLVLLSLNSVLEKLRIITPIKDTEVKEGGEIVASFLSAECFFSCSCDSTVHTALFYYLYMAHSNVETYLGVYTTAVSIMFNIIAPFGSDFVARTPLFLYVHPEIIWSSTEEKLRFLEPIEDNETQEKKTVSFVCKVNRPGATVRWLKAGQEVTLSKRIVYRVDGLKHSLTVKDCIMEDEGEYTAVVGDDKCAAELIISEAPTDFTAQLKDQTITEFEDAEFTCKLSKEKAAVKWYREGREIRAEDYKSLKYQMEKEGKTCRLIIKVCRPDDECEYACGVDERRTRARLFVEGEMFVSFCLQKPPQDVFEPPGSDIVFEVELNKDRVEVKWMRNNMIIVQGDKYQMISEGKVHRLQVCEIRPRDQGEYRIVAKDKDARAKLELAGDTNFSSVSPAAVPKIKTTDQNLVTDAGKPFVMTVPYDAYPRADAEWFFEGTSLPVQNIDTSLDKTEYRLKSPAKEDQGRYKVVIKNKHGEGEAFINLDVIGEVVDTVDGEVSLAWEEPENDGGSKIIAYVVERRDVKRKTWTVATDRADTPEYCVNVPDAPENVAVESVNKFGATITWEPPKFDGGSEITAYVIELRDRTSVKWEAALVCAADDRLAMLNDVVEYKEYIFRVRAENKAGIGRPSAATNPVKIMDPIGLPMRSKLWTLRVGRVVKIELPADVKGKPDPRVKWTKADVVLRADNRIAIDTQPGHSKVSIDNTTRGDTATYIIEAVNASALDISEITNESCVLAWNPPRDDGGSPITNYIVESRQTDKEEWVKLSATVKHTTFKATKLTALKEYIFRVSAENQYGIGEPAEHVPITAKYSFGAPTMDLEAKDVIVVEGEKLHLNIPYRAIPTPKMVWQKDTVECKAGDRLSLTVEMNSAHLELLKCSRGDAGAYAITLENSLGTATGTVNVKVIGKAIRCLGHITLLICRSAMVSSANQI